MWTPPEIKHICGFSVVLRSKCACVFAKGLPDAKRRFKP